MPASAAFPQAPAGGSTRFPSANEAVRAARGRRAGEAAADEVRIRWFIDEVCSKVAMGMRQRVGIAAHMLKDRVVRNISIPVVKGTGPRGGRVVTGRSVAGEYPRADTKQLMKTVFEDVRETSPGVFDGFVGTPLSYGLILETQMNRSFLVRSLYEVAGNIKSILSGPMT